MFATLRICGASLSGRSSKFNPACAGWGFGFPVCSDETQAVAKSNAAACAPDFYFFDQDRRLVYRGQFDDSRTSNFKPVSGALRSKVGAGPRRS